jgi:hypothetical protein
MRLTHGSSLLARVRVFKLPSQEPFRIAYVWGGLTEKQVVSASQLQRAVLQLPHNSWLIESTLNGLGHDSSGCGDNIC